MKRNGDLAGLVRRKNGTYHVDCMIRGKRHCFSTRTTQYTQAREVYEKFRAEQFATRELGKRPRRTFTEAVEAYLEEKRHLRTIADEERRLKPLVATYGDFGVDEIVWETIEPFFKTLMEPNKGKPRSSATLAHYMGVVRRVLESATNRTNDNRTRWLAEVPYLPKFDPKRGALVRKPLMSAEQEALFDALPPHLRVMATFAVNTGCRDGAVCGLRWDQEREFRALGITVFVVPNKGGGQVVVPLNRLAKEAVDSCRGQHAEYVFTFRGERIQRMNSTGWRKARKAAGVNATPHYLRHTFATRLRAAGVRREDIAELLGHATADVTGNYTAPGLKRLYECVQKLEPDEAGQVAEPLLLIDIK